MKLIGLDHVQLAMPPGGEEEARAFYAGILGLPEVPKPAQLAGRGGAWFEREALKLHLGVEQDFRPARKAHPALVVDGLTELADKLRAEGYELTEDVLQGRRRFHVHDPFGNRVEFLEAEAESPEQRP